MGEIANKENIAELKPAKKTGFDISPTNFEEAMRFAEMVAASNMVPKEFQNQPGNCLIAMQMGSELGIPPLQALQNIAVVNGRPAVWGDLLPALAQAHPQFEYLNESFDESTMTATCEIKRRNQPEQIKTFSKWDAETAGLWGRNTWKQYPKRMLQMRARGFAVRDLFPDALKGVAVAEDIIDLDPKDYSVVGSETRPASNEIQVITNEQALQIDAYITENELPREQLLQYFAKNFNSNTIEGLPTNTFDKVQSVLVEAVNRKKAAQEQQPESSEGAE